jgi:hypothetical protein
MSYENPSYLLVHQADAAISQANPVSTTLYEVLATTANVRIISIGAQIDWAVTQPTPMEVLVTIDGQVITFSVANPVSGSGHGAVIDSNTIIQALVSGSGFAYNLRGFLLEGKSVRVQIRITWAITQPTPLTCRVKYAKYVAV